MRRRTALPARCLATVVATVCAWLPWAPAGAQATYKCVRDGSTYYSDRPCDPDARPAAPRPSAPAPLTRRGSSDPTAHWRFMTPACRYLAETIQRMQEQATQAEDPDWTNPRLPSQQERYNDQCLDNEQQARERLDQELRDARDRQRAEGEAERAAQKQLTLTLAQCIEMRRIRDLRRGQMAALNAGERADLERFEANFTSRCTRVVPR